MIQTIAIDDEPLALKLVAGYIKRTPFLNLAGTFDNPLSALEFLETQQADLMFVDIQMPDLSGTEFVRSLMPKSKVIFTTAFEKYALEGFRLQAIDYLLKPFGYEEFLSSAQKAQRLIELEQKEASSVETNDTFLFLKSEYKIRRINFDEIIYIEGMKDYVKVFLRNEPNRCFPSIH
jgi:two-component system, LytTR family, response regulator LytT